MSQPQTISDIPLCCSLLSAGPPSRIRHPWEAETSGAPTPGTLAAPTPTWTMRTPPGNQSEPQVALADGSGAGAFRYTAEQVNQTMGPNGQAIVQQTWQQIQQVHHPAPPASTAFLQTNSPSRDKPSTAVGVTYPAGRLRLPFTMLRVVLDELKDRLATEEAWSDGEKSQFSEFSSELLRLNAIMNGGKDVSQFGLTQPSVASAEKAGIDTNGGDQNPIFVPSPPADPPASSSQGPPKARISAQYQMADDWKKSVIDLFKDLDVDQSGSISADELRRALQAAGVPLARLTKLLHAFDSQAASSGYAVEIDLDTWLTTIDSVKDEEMTALVQKLSRKSATGELFVQEKIKSKYVIHPTGKLRVIWDATILAVCLYIALVLPFLLAWEDDIVKSTVNKLDIVGRCIDVMFFMDIVLNFNTGFFNEDSDLVMTRREIIRHYLRGWFTLDVISTIPFDIIGLEDAENAQMLKLLKLGKLLKLFKMMMHSDMSEISETLEDLSTSKLMQMVYRRSAVLINAIFVSHWMACCMKLVDEGFLDVRGTTMWKEYLGAYYWSMTTLTTVGYGDMSPASDGERLFTIFAMVIGGGFYGYVVGTVTSMVSSSDLNATAFYERMELIHAWLMHHRLPGPIKSRLRRYFKAYLSEKSVVTEAEIWKDLSPELQREVGEYILHEDVKCNPLFDGLNMSAVVRLQSILQRVVVHAGRHVSDEGEAGTAMYIVVEGLLQMKGHTIKDGEEKMKTSILGKGQSYGEEILLGFREHYEYTVLVIEKAKMEMIAEEDFLGLFESMPNVLERMRKNALSLNPRWSAQEPTISR